MSKIKQFYVVADPETGIWLNEPVYVGEVDRDEWMAKEDDDDSHYDFFTRRVKVEDSYEYEDEECAIEVAWADEEERFYGYHVIYDEPDRFYAEVINHDRELVYEVRDGKAIDEGDENLFEEGHMSDRYDLDGLTKYLRDQGVINDDEEVMSWADYERMSQQY